MAALQSPDRKPPSWRTGIAAAVALMSPLAMVVTTALLIVAITVAGAGWLLVSPAGSAWLLRHLPWVAAQGLQTALLSDAWRADAVRVPWDGGRQYVLIEDVQATGLRFHWRPDSDTWLAITADRVAARKVTVHVVPGPDPVVMAAHFALPLRVEAVRVEAAEVQVDGYAALQAAAVDGFRMESRPGGEHRADRVVFAGHGVAVDGSVRLGVAAPLALSAQATVRPGAGGDAPAWAAALQAGGSMRRIELAGILRGVGVAAARPAPAVDLRAVVQPFADWPLAALTLGTESLDMRALSSRWPATRVSGRAELSGGSDGTPVAAAAELVNAAPGRWNEGRLPVQRLSLRVQGLPQQPDRVEATQFDVVLGDALHGAGRWTGSGVWQGNEATLATRLHGVNPQRVDGRAAAMTLAGPLNVVLRGLPTPTLVAAAAGSAPSAAFDLDLHGELDGAAQPVRVAAAGSADRHRIELQRVQAHAGIARADFAATLARAAPGAPWQVASRGSVADFDPAPWWPGSADSAWRRGPHRLSGDWQFDLKLPAQALRLDPLALAPRAAGNGRLRIVDSVLAGVPLAADVELGWTPGAGTLRAELRLAGNRVNVTGRGDPAGSGEADRWQIDLQAPALGAVAPLLRLHPDLAAWAPRQGSATVKITGSGRWPALRSEGSAQFTQWATAAASLARGSATWRFDMAGASMGSADGGAAPLSLQLDLAGLSWAGRQVDHLHAELDGTAADHRIEVVGATPLAPPALAEQLLGLRSAAGTQARLQAQGAWTPAAAGGGRWDARIDRLAVGGWDGRPGRAAPLADVWAETRDVRAMLQFGRGAELLELQAQAGRLRLADAGVLRWDDVRVQLGGARPRIELRADLEPFVLAPLLARAQPAMGWHGDLRLAAHVAIRAGDTMEAEVVFERRDGDLFVADGVDTRPLGLAELRLALSAHDGVWRFTPVLRGRTLGEIDGHVSVRTTPDRRWPHAQAPIEGSVLAHVRDLGIWSHWVPPGWRLTGELRTQAAIGGTFGAPQYTGAVSGSGLGVRNLLQGVVVADGQIAVKLAGDTAQIERFTLRGGDGLLAVTGGATFGGSPQARLDLAAERFRVLGRVDRQITASGRARLLLQGEQAQLDGKLTLDEALWDFGRSDAPALDDDVTLRQGNGEPPAPRNAEPAAARPLRHMTLALDIDLGRRARLRGWGVDTRLEGQVRLTSPQGRLAVHGTINAEDGTYAAYGQKLDIERGVVAFSGPPANPRLDVLALRPNIDNRVGVLIAGPLDTLRVRLYSDPEMSDTDKLSWLVLGRPSDGLGRNDTALLQRAAVALLAGEGEAPTDALMRNLGIDDISLRQSDGDVRETVVSLGKQLSRRWYVGYERGVNATTGTWQLIYRIAQRFTLRAQSGLENALDVIWTWRLQETPADAGMRKSTITPP